MKKMISMVLIILLIFSVGCSSNKETVTEVVETNEPMKEVEEQEMIDKFTENDFRNFFESYFSFTEDELLVLNQKRQTTDESYWINLKDYYQPLIKSKMGAFLADDVVSQLNNQYLFDEINLPKWVLLNSYIVNGTAKVDSIEIKSTRNLDENVIYEIAVTTINTCYPLDEFVANYTWGSAEGYFINKVAGVEYPAFDLYETNLEQLNSQRYMYSAEVDEMKLQQLFWVTVNEGSVLKIRSINNAETWGIDTANKQQLLDSQYITRVAYKEEASKDEKEFLNKLFITLMEATKGDYDYYEIAYNTSATIFQKMWEDMGFINRFDIQEAYYKEAFPISITPYKDEISTLTVNKERIELRPSIYSTKQQPRYVVNIPVEALLNNNQIVYYNYKYFIGMENMKVEFIQFMSMDEIEEGDYTGVTEEENQEVKNNQDSEQADNMAGTGV